MRFDFKLLRLEKEVEICLEEIKSGGHFTVFRDFLRTFLLFLLDGVHSERWTNSRFRSAKMLAGY